MRWWLLSTAGAAVYGWGLARSDVPVMFGGLTFMYWPSVRARRWVDAKIAAAAGEIRGR